MIYRDAAFSKFLLETAVAIAGMFLQNFVENRFKVLISSCQRTFVLLRVEGAFMERKQPETPI